MTAEMSPTLLRPTVDIVASFVSKNAVQSRDLSDLIGSVHEALSRLGVPAVESAAEPPKPAVPVRKSVQTDYIICLNDGKRFRSLKRHIRSRYGMTPDDYRAFWKLPPDYPMVAPGYARERSELAKAMGFGQRRWRSESGVAKPGSAG